MSSKNTSTTIEQAKKNLEYAVNLYNCTETPFDEEVITFAAQDKTATAYRNLALQKLKGEDVGGYLFTAQNSALDRIYHWQRWIREYEKGEAECVAIGEERGKTEGKRETARNLLSMGLSIKKVSEATGFSVEEIESLKRRGV
jgi:predicted transposase/invertase (TIGR01784 family)